MSTGVSGGSTGSLRLRKLPSGIEVENAPEVHEFPRRFVERELNDAVRLWIVIPSDPPVYYEVGAYSNGDFSAKRVDFNPQPKQQKKRWFRRNRG